MPTYRVLLFATLRDLAGQAEITLDLPEEARIADVRQALAQAHPALTPYLETAIFAVNHAFTTEETTLHPNDEIAAFPPVSGG